MSCHRAKCRVMFQAASLILVLFLSAAVERAWGQPETWGKAQTLQPGDRIELLLAKNKTVTGTLAQLSHDGLTLTRKRDSLQVARSDVLRIWALGKGSRLKNAGIAALVGFAVGCPIGAAKAGYLSDMNNPSFGTRAGFCAGLGGFAGGIAAGVAAAVPATKRTLVFESAALRR